MRIRQIGKCFVLPLMLIIVLSGCGSVTWIGNLFGSRAMMTIDEEELSSEAAKVLAAAQVKLIRDAYGEEAMETELADGTFASYAKESAAEAIQRTFILRCLADSEGISLSEDDQKEIENAVEAYRSSMEEGEDKKTDFSDEAIEEAIETVLLALRYESNICNIQGISADEEECRVIRGKQIVIYFSNEEEKAEAKNTMNHILELRQSGSSFTALCARYSQADETNVQFARGYFDDPDFDEAVFALSDGQSSEILERTSDSCFVIFYCLDSNVESMTEKNIEDAEEQECQTLIETAIEKYVSAHTSEWNTSAWNSIAILAEDMTSSADLYSICEGFSVN